MMSVEKCNQDMMSVDTNSRKKSDTWQPKT